MDTQQPKRLVLVLTKDLGDTVLASPAIREIVAHAQKEGYQMATVGGGLSKKAASLFADIDLPNDFDPQQNAANLALNFNFHQPDSDHNLHPDTPIYSIENMRLIEEREPAHYEGATVADKHMVHKFEEVLVKAGVLSELNRLPAPSAPDTVLTPEAIEAAREKYDLPENYALLMPGCAPTRPYKRWSSQDFAMLADKLADDGITPVLLSGPAQDELNICAEIQSLTQGKAIDLRGKTSLEDVCSLSAGANCVVANDTGPAHIAAASGAQTFALFSRHSDYNTWGVVPSRQDNAHTLVSDEYMSDLTPDAVYETIQQVKAHQQKRDTTPDLSR